MPQKVLATTCGMVSRKRLRVHKFPPCRTDRENRSDTKGKKTAMISRFYVGVNKFFLCDQEISCYFFVRFPGKSTEGRWRRRNCYFDSWGEAKSLERGASPPRAPKAAFQSAFFLMPPNSFPFFSSSPQFALWEIVHGSGEGFAKSNRKIDPLTKLASSHFHISIEILQ